MEQIIVVDKHGANIALDVGTVFEAINEDAGFRAMQYLGSMPYDDGRDCYLHDLQDGSFVNVHPSWFTHFEILIISR